jgi:hypothetical protein
MSQVLTKQPPRPAVPADLVEHAANEMGVPPAPPQLRRLTVDLRIEAQSADDSFLAPLVAEALQEFTERERAGHRTPEDSMRGKFETKAGLDVTWRATNEYFENGHRVELVGQDDARPVPLSVAQLVGDCLVMDGVRYSLVVFKTLANPDPAKRYQFVRQGDTVTVVERP